MTTIKDVAQLVGVSVATVSRTYQFPDRVAPHTRQRVLRAAEKARYQPDVLARNFRTRRSRSVMVLVPNIANPFFSEILRAVQLVAHDRGYAVLLGDTQGEKSRESAYASFLETRQADGLLQLGPRAPIDLLMAPSEGDRSTPFVHLCEAPRSAEYPSVRIDNRSAAAAMTQHIIDSGRRRIAIVLGPRSSPLTKDRLSGWRACLKSNGLEPDPALIIPGDFTLKAGQVAGEHLLRMRPLPDAVFCLNDEMAIGAIHTF